VIDAKVNPIFAACFFGPAKLVKKRTILADGTLARHANVVPNFFIRTRCIK
jgi:hypothetical protein